MGIIQPCILGSCRPVRPVWMPGRGQGSPLICHRNCWCRTSRVSRSVSVDLSLSPCFHTCSLYLTLSLLCRSDFTLSLSLSGVVMVTTFWYYRPSVLEEELEFDTEIPSQCPLPKPGARMHAGRMFLQKNPTDVFYLYVFFMFNISSVDFLVYFVVWLLSHLWDTECDQELAG